MISDLCVRCGRPAEGFTVYRGWRLCHGAGMASSCYDIAHSILEATERFSPGVDVAALQARLEECWALLRIHAPDYLRDGLDPELIVRLKPMEDDQ